MERQSKRKEGGYEGIVVKRRIWPINPLSYLVYIFCIVYSALYLKMIDGAIQWYNSKYILKCYK